MVDFIVSNWVLLTGLIGAGLAAGIIAGMFGIGGGVVIVPTLAYLFHELGYGETAMHVAVGTSLSTIILTSARSVWSHHKRGAVDWQVLRNWVPAIVIGTLIGSQLAARIDGTTLQVVFGCVLTLLALQIGLGRPTWRLADDLPSGPVKWGLGGFMGGLSAILGIGGGTLGVSLMTLCGRTAHQAVATAAGFGIAIGVPGALGFVVGGWGEAGLPPGSLGYVNLLAFGVIATGSVSMAPVGVAIAHALNPQMLKRLFAVGLAGIALKMVIDGVTAM